MKKIVIIVISLILVIVSTISVVIINSNKDSKSNFKQTAMKVKSKKKNSSISKTKPDEKPASNEEKNDTTNIKKSDDNNKNIDNNKPKGSNSNTNETENNSIQSKQTVKSSDIQGTKNVTSPPNTAPERSLTEWEKLGISEYDYYNTPSDNEGELVFKGDMSLCQNEINRLVNKYYDSGLDGGNYYTINGKYTHSYLGCGIKMYMNGQAYTYSQIKSMGFN